MIDIPTASEYLEAQKSTANDAWMRGFDACRQLALELGALDDLTAESQQLALYRNNSVLVPCDKLKEMQDHLSLLQDRARAVVARWDGPKWKDLPHTANFIHALRDVID